MAIGLITGALAFEFVCRWPEYACLEFGGAGRRLREEHGRGPSPGAKSRMTVCIAVPDVDALCAEPFPRLRLLPAADVQPPSDKPWKQREFMVR